MSEWETVLAVDFDRWAAETYRANFPGVRVECGPVADYLDTMPAADVVIGGPPCQPFSDAGENEGEQDGRDGMPDFMEAVRRVRPRMFLMENVRGLLKEKHLPYFGRVLSGMEGMGYRVAYKVLDAVSFGVPQFRERVFVWGIRSDVAARHRWPQPTHAWPAPGPCMFGGALLPAVTVGEALGLDGIGRVYGGGRNGPVGGDPARKESGEWTRYERDITREPCTTISASMIGSLIGGTHPRVHLTAVGAAYNCRGKGDGGNQWRDVLEPAPTLNTNGLDGVESGWRDDPKHPVNVPGRPAVAQPSGGSGHSAPDHTITLREGQRIRRFSPMECLRLQSGPDDFAWPAQITKTNMYKVVGNGWACRMGTVLAEAFRAADPKSRTIIDLFCGGGLGACGWHGRYWHRASDFDLRPAGDRRTV